MQVIGKGRLLGIITLLTVSGLAGVVLISSTMPMPMMIHSLLHMGGLIIALFLASMAIVSYRRIKNPRLLLVMSAFLLFAGVETFYVANAGAWAIIPGSTIEIPHIMAILTLVLFAMGVVKL